MNRIPSETREPRCYAKFSEGTCESRSTERNVTATNYSISLLAASTESWLGEFCAGKNVSGGFVNRHLLVSGKPTRVLPKPKRPSPDLWSDIVNRFAALVPLEITPIIEEGQILWSGKKRTIGWASDTEAAWHAYYRKRTSEMRTIQSEILVELSARESTHAIKLAGLAAFMDRRLIVGPRDLEFGVKFARWSTQNAINLIVQNVRHYAGEADRVLTKLRKSGPISKTDLARGLGGAQKEINRAIGHLIVDGVLEDCPDGLLRIQTKASNLQQEEIEKFFGKSDISEFIATEKLGVGSPSSPLTPSEFSFTEAP
jgi:hypothetical protein